MSFNHINFASYGYFPALRTRQAEIKGLVMLAPERKNSIIPLLTLGRWPRANELETSVEKCMEAMEGRPFFLDLTYDMDNLSTLIQNLRNTENGFVNWIQFVSKYQCVIPVIQFNPLATVRDIMIQAKSCEAKFGKLAFRIKDYTQHTNLVIAALSALDNAENAIVFIDSQYIRDSYSASLAATISTINLIRTQVPNAIISTLATSFPVSVLPYSSNGQSGAMDILERHFHGQIGGYPVVTYGDYGSIHAVVYDNDPSVMRWSARVDFPQELVWEFERRPESRAKEGYMSAAQSIVNREINIGTKNIWGEQMILNAAHGGETVGSTPASWISVRVNIHLSRQIDFTQQILNSNGQEWDEDVDF